MRNTVFTPFLGAFLPLYSIINYSVTASLQTKLLGIKRVFRDKTQKSNNEVIDKIFSTLTCRVLILCYNRVIKGGLIYANGTNA